MIRYVAAALLAFFAFHVEAQRIEVNGAKVPLPDGNVLGVALDEGQGMFFVQQSVLSPGANGRGISSRLQITSWGLQNHSLIKQRTFPEAAAGASAFPCDRVEASAESRRVYVCSAGSRLDIIDPNSLTTVGTMAQADGQAITDFAVDDAHGRVLVLSAQRDGSIHLASYSLQKGEKQQDAVVSTANSTRMSLAVAPRTGQIGISLDVPNRAGNKADIYTCTDSPDLVCSKIAETDAVSQMSFLGRQMLVATSIFADNKKDCILTVDPMTRAVSREYCSPSTGVHYAVGVADKAYVIGFTGISKRNWFSEENKSVASSFSIWRAENPQAAAVAKDPTDYGAFQNEIRVVASSTRPIFIAYQRVSNLLCLYSIVDRN